MKTILLLSLLLSAPQSTVTIDATLAGKPVQSTFYLLEINPTPEFQAMPASAKSYRDGLRLRSAYEELLLDCGQNLPEIAATYEKYVRYTLKSGVPANVAPGRYFIFGRAGSEQGCAVWLQEVNLASDTRLIFNQHNAL